MQRLPDGRLSAMTGSSMEIASAPRIWSRRRSMSELQYPLESTLRVLSSEALPRSRRAGLRPSTPGQRYGAIPCRFGAAVDAAVAGPLAGRSMNAGRSLAPGSARSPTAVNLLPGGWPLAHDEQAQPHAPGSLSREHGPRPVPTRHGSRADDARDPAAIEVS